MAPTVAVKSEGKGAFIDSKGKCVTGSAHLSVNGELEAVTITFDNGMLDIETKMVGGRPVMKATYAEYSD
jgi:hypothetical protein